MVEIKIMVQLMNQLYQIQLKKLGNIYKQNFLNLGAVTERYYRDPNNGKRKKYATSLVDITVISESKTADFVPLPIIAAVALKEGLITPIVKNADKKGLKEISNEIKELAIKAKKGILLPDEYNGGTISLSNLY